MFGRNPDRLNKTKSMHFRRISILQFFSTQLPSSLIHWNQHSYYFQNAAAYASLSIVSMTPSQVGFWAVRGQREPNQELFHMGEQEEAYHRQIWRIDWLFCTLRGWRRLTVLRFPYRVRLMPGLLCSLFRSRPGCLLASSKTSSKFKLGLSQISNGNTIKIMRTNAKDAIRIENCDGNLLRRPLFPLRRSISDSGNELYATLV